MNWPKIEQILKDVPFFVYHIFLSVLLILAAQTLFFQKTNFWLIDPLRPRLPASENIVLVIIDNETLQHLEDPFSPEVIRTVLQKVDQGKPKVIGLEKLDDALNLTQVKKALTESTSPVVVGTNLSTDPTSQDASANVRGYVNIAPPDTTEVHQIQLSSPTISGTRCEVSFALAVVNILTQNKQPVNCLNQVRLANGHSADNLFAFHSTSAGFTTVSYYDLYQGRVDSSIFANKAVLIGPNTTQTNAAGVPFTHFLTVGQKLYPRVEIQAMVINDLLEGKYFFQLPNWLLYLIIILLSHIFLLAARLLSKVSLVTALFAGFTGVLLFIELTLLHLGLNMNILATLILMINSFAYVLMYRHISLEKHSSFLQNAFSHYVNPHRLQELVNAPGKLQLGGEQKIVTVLFVDIRNYTSLSEILTPRQLIGFTNRYLDTMSRIIIKNNGTIDKFIGDAIMAFWNAPVADPDHPRKAIVSALEMVDELDKFNDQFSQFDDIQIGIGVNTGPVIVGNIGGKQRFDYTILGDNVNLTYRLEGLTKQYKVPVIMTRPVPWKAEVPHVIFRLLDKVTVKGRRKPVVLYQPMFDTPENNMLKNTYEEAWLLYQDGDFRKAERIFQELPEDPPAQLMLDRIASLLKRKSHQMWNGIWQWSEK